MTASPLPDASPWADATLAAALCAIDSGCGGVLVRAGAGPVRDEWLARLELWLPESAPVRRIPAHVPDDRLLGGLDLVATLRAGRPVVERGLLAAIDGGLGILAGAERVSTLVAARIATALEAGEVRVEREGIAATAAARYILAAFDEGVADDEQPPQVLLERLAFRVDLWPVALRDMIEDAIDPAAVAAARARVTQVVIDEACVTALCATAMGLGVASMRASVFAVRAARALAALDGCDAVADRHAAIAARLVLAPRATRLPPQPAEEESPPAEDAAPPEPPTEDVDEQRASNPDDLPLEDVVLAAAVASIPPGLLAQLRIAEAARARSAGAGRAGAEQKGGARGRPAGVTRGEPRRGARLNVIETLRAAAPWQPVRQRLRAQTLHAARAPRVEVRSEDFRVQRYRKHARTTTIFVVDASGSAALHRLGEAKGAVELLLGECYVRRDRVALLAFRGRAAELVVPPTRSLVRAKRCLAGMPGGGGTPLANGIEAAFGLAEAIRRQGDTPVLVFLTDGRANVARDGRPDRAAAESQALAAARCIRAAGLGAILVDTAPRAQPLAAQVAEAMGARYLPLPHARSRDLDAAIRGAARD